MLFWGVASIGSSPAPSKALKMATGGDLGQDFTATNSIRGIDRRDGLGEGLGESLDNEAQRESDVGLGLGILDRLEMIARHRALPGALT